MFWFSFARSMLAFLKCFHIPRIASVVAAGAGFSIAVGMAAGEVFQNKCEVREYRALRAESTRRFYELITREGLGEDWDRWHASKFDRTVLKQIHEDQFRAHLDQP